MIHVDQMFCYHYYLLVFLHIRIYIFSNNNSIDKHLNVLRMFKQNLIDR
jgi:hypothetical protein